MPDPAAGAPWMAADPAPALPDKPSLAVLPFRSLADDPESRAFADGVSEHLTYTLACIPGLFVSGSPSAFTFRDARVDPRRAARDLGVAHLLRGTVEAAAGRITLAAQLVAGADGAELWSERHEGRHADAPALQARVAERTVLTIAPELAGARPGAGRTRFPPGLGVYTRFLAAYTGFASTSADSIGPLMRTLYDVARTLPDQPLPLAMLAQCQTFLVSQGWGSDPAAESAEGLRLARAALAMPGAGDNAIVLRLVGNTLAFLGQDYETALALIARSIALNPNSAATYERGGWVRCYVGEAEAAEAWFRAAKRQSPLDRDTFLFDSGLGLALCMQGRHEEAVGWLRRAVDDRPTWTSSYRVLAASLAHLGRPDEAAAAVRDLLAREPSYRIARAERLYRDSAGKAVFVGGMRLAGVPE